MHDYTKQLRDDLLAEKERFNTSIDAMLAALDAPTVVAPTAAKPARKARRSRAQAAKPRKAAAAKPAAPRATPKPITDTMLVAALERLPREFSSAELAMELTVAPQSLGPRLAAWERRGLVVRGAGDGTWANPAKAMMPEEEAEAA